MLYFVFSSLYLLFNKSKLLQIDYLGWKNRLLVIVLFLFEGFSPSSGCLRNVILFILSTRTKRTSKLFSIMFIIENDRYYITFCL